MWHQTMPEMGMWLISLQQMPFGNDWTRLQGDFTRFNVERIDASAILQADLAALWHGLDALLGWQAQAAAQAVAGGYATQVPAVQTAFMVDAGNLGGLVEASAVDVQATGTYSVHCWPLDLSSRGSV